MNNIFYCVTSILIFHLLHDPLHKLHVLKMHTVQVFLFLRDTVLFGSPVTTFFF